MNSRKKNSIGTYELNCLIFFFLQVLINDGPYRGIMIHLVLHIPDDYPLTGPAGNIAPGLEFDQTYHSHIHNDGRYG
jgi:ubiquitin-protein ligase